MSYKTIGKIFRPIALVCLAIIAFGMSFIMFSDSLKGLTSFEIFGTIGGMWGTVMGIILFLIGSFPLWILFKDKPSEDEYGDWTAWFFITILVILFYFVSKWLETIGIHI